MIQTLNGTTRVLAIIGNPVGHSKSPVMHNAVLQACGLNYVYVPFQVAPDRLCEAVAGLKALGVVGVNVTIPYKSDVMKYLDELDVTAIDAGAVNTINNISGRLIGYNTDGDGLVTSLAQDLGFTPEGRTILVLGAGGAARGALAALGRAGAGRIMVYNRTCDAAIALASDMTVRYPGTIVTALNDVRELEAALVESDLLINATSVGMHDEVMPSLRPELLPGTAKVYDMVYAPPMTPLLSVATSRGLRCANGFGMLAAQGELAFSIWTGVKPPVGLMLRVLTDICNT